MKYKRLQRFYRYPYGTKKEYITLMLENISLEDFAKTIRPQIRKPIGLLLVRNKIIFGYVIRQQIKDYINLRKYKIYPLYKENKNIKGYFLNLDDYIQAVTKYAYTSPRWDVLPLTQDGYSNSLFIVLDTLMPVNEFKESDVYLLLKRFLYKVRQKDIEGLPENIVLTLIKGNKTTYIPLIVNGDYSKLLQSMTILRKFYDKLTKISGKENIDEVELSALADEIVSSSQEENEPVNKDETEKVASLLKAFVSTKTDRKNLKLEIVKSIIPKDRQPKDEVEINEYIRKEFSKTLLKPEPVKLHRINPVSKVINEDEILDGSLPTQVNKYREYEFVESPQRLVSVINSYSSTFGLRVINYDIERVPPKSNDIAPSDVFYLKLKFVDIDTNKQFEVRLKLPTLREDGTLLINGKRWYIVNQLALLPITFPKPGVGKFTSMTGSFLIERIKKYTKILIAGNVLPISLFMSYIWDFDYMMKLLSINWEISDGKPKSKTPYVKLPNDKYLMFPDYNNYDEFTQDFIRSLFPFKNIDKVHSEYEPLTKEWLEDVIKHITESELIIDYMKQTLPTLVDSVTYNILKERNEPTNLKDIILYMYRKVVEGFVTDRNDLRYLRNRAYEQIVHIAFDVLKQELNKYRNYKLNGKDATLKLNPDQVFTAIVTSSSVRMLEFSNPLEEVVANFKVTYAGYGGIPADAVPEQIRGIHPSFFGNIDPVDTPEGATTGVNQTYSIGTTISTKYGAIIPHELTEDIRAGVLSLSTASSPFIDKTEPTRGIMVANQSRQAVTLVKSEPPAVLTGVEFIIPQMASDTFIKKSICNGKVEDVNENSITVKCDDGKTITYDLSPKLARSGQGYHGSVHFYPIVRKGQKVSKGDPLTDSDHIKDGIMSLGKNFLTTYMFFDGLTYEDSILVSEDIVEDLTSRHVFELFTFLDPTDKLIKFDVDIGKTVETGDLIIQAVSDKLYNLIEYGILNEDEIQIYGNKYTIRAPYRGKIIDIKVYNNSKDVLDPSIQEKVNKFMTKSENSSFVYKGRRFEGVFIYVYIESEIPLQIGDKLTNRHAAKGVISRILPKNQMPLLPDGRRVEVVINPISVSGRINMGQIFELYTGEISYQLAKIAVNKPKKQLIDAIKKSLLILDKSTYTKSLLSNIERDDKYYEELVKYCKKYGFLPIVVPPFKTPTYKEILTALNNMNIPEKYELYIPKYDTKIKAPAGYMYIYKLEHMATAKIHARSLGPYQRKTGQATAGKRAEGGQRLGELDFWALAAYDAVPILEELFSAGSDDFKIKRQIYRQIIKEGEASISELKEGDKKSKKYVEALFKGIMIEY